MTDNEYCAQFRAILRRDRVLMLAVTIVKNADLPDAWVTGGAIRGVVWDCLHGYENRTPFYDVDVIYFDPQGLDKQIDRAHEASLRNAVPPISFSVKNQARMHRVNGDPRYLSTADALSKVPDTASAIAVAMGDDGELRILSPFGLKDLLEMRVRPTSYGKEHLERYWSRTHEKRWAEKWPRVQILGS